MAEENHVSSYEWSAAGMVWGGPFWESWLSSVSWQGLRSVGKATCPNSEHLGFMYFLLWFLQQKSHTEVLHRVCQQECIIHLNPAKTEGFKGFKAKHAGPRFVPCVFSKSWTPHSDLHDATWPGCCYLFRFIFGHVLWSPIGLFPNSPSLFQT